MLYTVIYDDGRLGWACAGSFPARLPRPGAAYPLPPWMLLVMLSRIYSSPDKAMASPSSAESPSPKVWSAQFIVNFSQTVHVSGDDVVAEYKRERSLVVRTELRASRRADAHKSAPPSASLFLDAPSSSTTSNLIQGLTSYSLLLFPGSGQEYVTAPLMTANAMRKRVASNKTGNEGHKK